MVGNTYNGLWSRDRLVRGIIQYKNGEIKMGEMKDGKLHSGWAKLVLPGGCVYEGQWRDGRM